MRSFTGDAWHGERAASLRIEAEGRRSGSEQEILLGLSGEGKREHK